MVSPAAGDTLEQIDTLYRSSTSRTIDAPCHVTTQIRTPEGGVPAVADIPQCILQSAKQDSVSADGTALLNPAAAFSFKACSADPRCVTDRASSGRPTAPAIRPITACTRPKGSLLRRCQHVPSHLASHTSLCTRGSRVSAASSLQPLCSYTQ